MHFKKYIKLDSKKNIANLIVSDIESGREIQAFDIRNLNDLCTFEEIRQLNKAYYKGERLQLKYQAQALSNKAKKEIRAFMTR